MGHTNSLSGVLDGCAIILDKNSWLITVRFSVTMDPKTVFWDRESFRSAQIRWIFLQKSEIETFKSKSNHDAPERRQTASTTVHEWSWSRESVCAKGGAPWPGVTPPGEHLVGDVVSWDGRTWFPCGLLAGFQHSFATFAIGFTELQDFCPNLLQNEVVHRVSLHHTRFSGISLTSAVESRLTCPLPRVRQVFLPFEDSDGRFLPHALSRLRFPELAGLSC